MQFVDEDECSFIHKCLCLVEGGCGGISSNFIIFTKLRKEVHGSSHAGFKITGILFLTLLNRGRMWDYETQTDIVYAGCAFLSGLQLS